MQKPTPPKQHTLSVNGAEFTVPVVYDTVADYIKVLHVNNKILSRSKSKKHAEWLARNLAEIARYEAALEA